MSLRASITAASSGGAVALGLGMALTGWFSAIPLLTWVSSGPRTQLVLTDPNDPNLARGSFAAALAAPVLLGWIAALVVAYRPAASFSRAIAVLIAPACVAGLAVYARAQSLQLLFRDPGTDGVQLMVPLVDIPIGDWALMAGALTGLLCIVHAWIASRERTPSVPTLPE